MKIFHVAINREIYQDVYKRESELTLDKLFDGKLRWVIPLDSEKMNSIMKALENGDTQSKSKYKVDKAQKAAYRYVTKDGKLVLDPRPMRIGKVIQRELGEEWAKVWSVESNSEDSSGLSAIVSRSPIDIVRMSDHKKWISCHSPNGSYFTHAVEEAKDGGAVAYVIKNEDLKSLIENSPEKEQVLQQEEIFEDIDRNIKGIRPISRLRINRYVDNDDDEELAIPVDSIYGDRISGFYDSVKRWAKEKQATYLDLDNLNLRDFKRTGGEYADSGDSSIIEDFFGDKRGITRDLEHKGGEGRFAIWKQEVASFESRLNAELKHHQMFGDVSRDDGELNIHSGSTLSFKFRGSIDSAADLDWEVMTKIMRETEIIGSSEHGELSEENGVVTLLITVYYDDIYNPDAFYDKGEELKSYELKKYWSDAYLIQDFLINNGYLITGVDSITDASEYATEIGANENEYGEIELQFNTGIKVDQMDTYSSFYKDGLTSLIFTAFRNSLKNNFELHGKNEANQMAFPFYYKYDPSNSGFDISKIQLQFDVTLLESYESISFSIDIPNSELYRLGKKYFGILLSLKNNIGSDINNAIMDFLSKWPKKYQRSNYNWYLKAKTENCVRRICQ